MGRRRSRNLDGKAAKLKHGLSRSGVFLFF
jgi:hypothetical protein